MITTQGRLSSKERKYRSENDDLWLVNKPYKYGDKWSVWSKTILNDMEISDCNDTIEGVCLENQTLDECINRCTGDCGAGVYFKFHNGKSICVPIRTAVHPSFNPIYRLRKQSYYDIKDVDVSVFVNTELFPNPPDLGNAILYFDSPVSGQCHISVSMVGENSSLPVKFIFENKTLSKMLVSLTKGQRSKLDVTFTEAVDYLAIEADITTVEAEE